MGNTRRKRVLIVSGAVILLCFVIIVGMSMALFTDYKNVTNHLQAGNLSIGLKRTYLEYSVLDDYGKLSVTKNTQPVNFTGSTNKNVFGMDATNVYIVPGSYFLAEMELSNAGNVAFTYNLSIKMLSGVNALADQLQVTITDHNGKSTTKLLSEMVNGLTINAGEMTTKDKAQKFKVKISFIDDVDYNKTLATGQAKMDNDLAQTQSAIFDLVVTAVQLTPAAATTSATQSTTP